MDQERVKPAETPSGRGSCLQGRRRVRFLGVRCPRRAPQAACLGCTPAPISSKPTGKSVHTAQKSWLPLWDPPADVPTAQSEELVTTPCSSPEMALLLSQLCLSLKVWCLCSLRKYFFLLNICMNSLAWLIIPPVSFKHVF